VSTLLVKVKEMFSFQQGLRRKAVRLIADSCQHLKKLRLDIFQEIWDDDDDVIHVINRLGKQLTTLALSGGGLKNITYSYLNNCAR
jgi:hypothetical protein